MNEGLSVVVCCYNSAGRLPQTLEHLLQQKTNDFNLEIIVVDNASTDSTSVMAEQIFGQQLAKDNYKVVTETEPGLSNARRRGHLTAQYEYILFCDDDNWLAPDYLQLVYDIMNANPAIGILGGKGEAVFEKVKPSWFDTYQLNFAVGPQAPNTSGTSEIETAYGAGFTIRKTILDKLDALQFESLLSDRKGNQLMSGGDTELCIVTKYLGYKVCYNPGLTFKHLMPPGRMNWDYLKKLYFGFGRTRVYTQAYHMLERNDNKLPYLHLKYPLWLDKYIHRLQDMKLYLPRVLFLLNQQGNGLVLQYMALRGELYELRTLKNNYPQVFEKIIAFKNRIAELNNKK